MTTTVRPAGPARHGADGTRSRDYTVCVNGRPVGRLRLATDERHGARVGRVVSLEIDEADRGRGRGAVAALAAEEVLRDWGCRRVHVRLSAEAVPGLRLAAALGYVERDRALTKRLTVPPPLPADARLRPMDEADYAVWHRRTRADHAARWIEDGATPERAAAVADAEYAAALPDGRLTAGTALRVLSHGAVDLGWLWVRAGRPDLPGAPAWVFLVEVAEAHRGQGHGRTLMLVAERECLAVGTRDLGLNVLRANTPALRLYESLGYRPVAHELSKPLL